MKVSTYFQQQELTPVEPPAPNPEKMSMVGHAAEEFGAGVSYAGNVLNQLVVEKQKINSANLGVSLANMARQRLQDLDIELKKVPDDATHMQNWQEGFEKIETDIMAKAGGNKDVETYLQRSLAEMKTAYGGQAKDFAFQTYVSRNVGVAEANIHELEQQAIAAPDDATRIRYQTEGREFIKSVITSLKGADAAELELQRFDKNIASGSALKDIEADPKAALVKLGNPKSYPGLDEGQRINYTILAKNKIKSQEKEDRELFCNNVYLGLKKTHGMYGYSRMLDDLQNPDFLEEKKITYAEANEISGRISNEQRNYNADIAKKQDDRATALWSLVSQHKMTAAQIYKEVDTGQLSYNVGQAFIALLQRKEASTDYNIYSGHFRDILDGKKPMQQIREEILIDAGKGILDGPAVDRLWEKMDRKEDKMLKHEESRGLHIIEQLILPQNPMTKLFEGTPAQKERCYDTQNKLSEWIYDSQMKGKTPTRKEIQDEAVRLGNDARLSQPELLDELRKNQQKEREEGKKKIESKQNPLKQLPGETFDQWEERMLKMRLSGG